jgi:hypothetical protein
MRKTLIAVLCAIPLTIGCAHPPRQKVVLCLEGTVNVRDGKNCHRATKIPVTVKVEYHLEGPEAPITETDR